jgi:hypothetical protein
MCVDFLYNLPEAFFISSTNQWNNIINVKSLHLRYPLLLSDFNQTWAFSVHFRGGKKAQMSNIIKILSVGAELFHTDGQSGRNDEAKSRFSLFY